MAGILPSRTSPFGQEQRELAAELRAQSKTWVEIAHVFAERYRLNMRVALRQVRDWSQGQAADQWNDQWPADPKTFKSFSKWELWPASTGHAPSLDVLARLAYLYECRIADLLADAADFRGADAAYRQQQVSVLTDGENVHQVDPVTQTDYDFSGIWHSRYIYYSTSRRTKITGEHFVVARQQSNRLMGESVPASNGSTLKLDLELNGSVATGTWSERTSPTGYYRGAVYHGAVQLMIDPMGKSMTGKWIGFDREFAVNSDEWTLTWQEDGATRNARRAYHLKA